jgi:hypothetical protein
MVRFLDNTKWTAEANSTLACIFAGRKLFEWQLYYSLLMNTDKSNDNDFSLMRPPFN